MSKLDKAKERILSKPKDYTYTEARYLLSNWDLKNLIRGRHPGQGYDFIGKVIKK